MDFVSERYSDPGLRAPGELRDTVMGLGKKQKIPHPAIGTKGSWCHPNSLKTASLTRDKGREPPSSESGYRTSVTGFQHPGSLWADLCADSFRHCCVCYYYSIVPRLYGKIKYPGEFFAQIP